MKEQGLNAFLAEAAVMTAVMAAALAICLGVFSASAGMRTRADRLSRASSLVYSAAQCYTACGDIAGTSRLMGGDGSDTVARDDITLRLEEREGGIMISAIWGGEVIFAAPAAPEVE